MHRLGFILTETAVVDATAAQLAAPIVLGADRCRASEKDVLNLSPAVLLFETIKLALASCSRSRDYALAVLLEAQVITRVTTGSRIAGAGRTGWGGGPLHGPRVLGPEDRLNNPPNPVTTTRPTIRGSAGHGSRAIHNDSCSNRCAAPTDDERTNMRRPLILLMPIALAACSAGDPLPSADANRPKVTLLYVMNCVHAAQIQTIWKAGDKKHDFAAARHDYWANVKLHSFNKNVERKALRRLELASINQTKHDAKLNLGQQEKIQKYWPILERCAAREVPRAELQVDYVSELH